MEKLEEQYGFHLSATEEKKVQRRMGIVAWLMKYSLLWMLLFIFITVFWMGYSLDHPVLQETLSVKRIVSSSCLVVIVGMCVYTWFKLNKSWDRSEFFTHQNADLIIRLGNVTEMCGLLIGLLETQNDILGYLFLCLPFVLGSLFCLVGGMIRKGVEMQEEQKLTV